MTATPLTRSNVFDPVCDYAVYVWLQIRPQPHLRLYLSIIRKQLYFLTLAGHIQFLFYDAYLRLCRCHIGRHNDDLTMFAIEIRYIRAR